MNQISTTSSSTMSSISGKEMPCRDICAGTTSGGTGVCSKKDLNSFWARTRNGTTCRPSHFGPSTDPLFIWWELGDAAGHRARVFLAAPSARNKRAHPSVFSLLHSTFSSHAGKRMQSDISCPCVCLLIFLSSQCNQTGGVPAANFDLCGE